MPAQIFALRLTPPRPDFPFTMTPDEQNIMEQHAAYLEKLRQAGTALIYGPVLDPAGAYGLAILRAEDEEEVKEIIANDPAASINTYSYAPMLATLSGQVDSN